MNKGKGHTSVAQTPEMAISRALQPLLSNKQYCDGAKSVMNKYNLDSSMLISKLIVMPTGGIILNLH